MMYRLPLCLITILVLGACASRPDCLVEQRYHDAQEFPPLKAPAGMVVPSTNPNLAIPPVEDGPIAYVDDDTAKNDFGVRCLETPPRLSNDA